MKRIKKLCSLCVAGLMLFNGFGCLPAQAEPAPEPEGVLLDTRYYTAMPLESGGEQNDLTRLNNKLTDNAVVAKLPVEADLASGEYYIDIVSNGYISNFKSLDLGCAPAHIGYMDITRIGIAAYDDETQTWPAAPTETHDVSWVKSGADYTGKAVVNLEQPIKTSRLRVYILGANRKYEGMLRMEELAAYGEWLSEQPANVAKNASVTAENAEFESGKPLSNAVDGDHATEAVSIGGADSSNPPVITMELDKTYDLSSMDLVTLHSKPAGITRMKVEYRQDGEWKELREESIAREDSASGASGQIDRIELGVTADALRFTVLEHKTGYGHFRFSDFVVYGTEAAEPAPELIGTKLDARSYTEMPLESGNRDMEKLNDGTMDGAVVVSLSKDVDMSDGSYYVDIVCNGYEATFQSLDLGCNEGLVDTQGIKKIGIAAYDDAAQTWPAGPAETHDITWPKSGGAYTGKTVVHLNTPVTSSRLRVYILDANREWDNFRMEELAAYGELTGNRVESLAKHAAVTANFECDGGKPLSSLTDQDFATEMLTNFEATAENPGIITMDFGESYYEFESMDMAGLFSTDAGVTAMTIEYLQEGNWVKLKDESFARSGRYGTTNSQIDRIALGVTTNGLRFKITDYVKSWGHFRISELALYGKAGDSPDPGPDPEPVKSLLDAVYLTTVPLDPSYSDLKRLNNQSVYANEPVVVNVSKDVNMGRDYCFDVVFKGKLADVQGIEFACYQAFFKHQSVKRIDVDWYDEASGQWKAALTDHVLAWKQSSESEDLAKAMAYLPAGIKTSRIRVYIKDANREWDNLRIEEMAVYGEMLEEKPENLAAAAETSVSYAFDPVYYAAANLTDGDYDTKLTSKEGVQPSEQEPVCISFDFGGDYYKIDALELATAYARYCGILTGELQYLEYGAWKTLKPFNFTRGGIAATDDYEIDQIAAGVVTNGLRLKITSVILDQTYHNFSINEITVRGSRAEAPPQPRPVECQTEPGFEALTDGDAGTVWTSPFEEIPSTQAPHVIRLGFQRAVSPKILIFAGSEPLPSKVAAGYEIDGVFTAFGPETELVYQDGTARVILPETAETETLVLHITGADRADYTLAELSVLAFDRYDSVAKAIETFAATQYYDDFLLASEAVKAIADEAIRAEFAAQLDSEKQKAVKNQNINAVYDAAAKTVELSGRLFIPADVKISLQIKGASAEMTVEAAADQTGAFRVTADVSGLHGYGTYTVTAVVEGETVTGSFDLRPQKSGKEILRFSIDGNAGKISGSSIRVTLPKGSTASGRVPVFQLSEGAVLLHDGTVAESGKTAFDFRNPVTLTVRAENGETASYTVTVTVSSGGGSGGSGSGGGGGSHMGGSNIVLPNENQKPGPEDEPNGEETGFADVPADHWAHGYIEALRRDGIINGAGENRFYPEDTVKREEFVKMLVLTLGMEPGGKSGFADAAENWSDPYLAAAEAVGLANGIADGMFGVGQDISRQDLAVMIYRALPETMKPEQTGEAFEDDEAIADYAKEAVYGLRTLGLLNGYENRFRPGEQATRAESAKILAGFKGVWEK